MKKAYKPILLFAMAISKANTSCFWCGQVLSECVNCKGTGSFNDTICTPYTGNGRLCPTHEGNWAG